MMIATFNMSVLLKALASSWKRPDGRLDARRSCVYSCWVPEACADGGRDTGTDGFDGLHELRMRQRGRVHLKAEARDAAQHLGIADDLLHDFFGVADDQGAVRTPLRVAGGPGDGGPSALPTDPGDRTGVAGEEVVGGLLRRRGHVAQRVHADLQAIGRVPGSPAHLTVDIDERPEALRPAPDDGDHQGKS